MSVAVWQHLSILHHKVTKILCNIKLSPECPYAFGICRDVSLARQQLPSEYQCFRQ